MTVMTVLCHGTGRSQVADEEHAKAGELISWLGRNMAGTQANVSYNAATKGSTWTAGNFIINEGPGHEGIEGAILPQNFGVDGKVSKQGPLDSLLGNKSGRGWTTNVDRTQEIITSLKTPMGLTGVNLIGWSRGAVTCIRIANKLLTNEATASLPCNIFAIDPVAGTGSKDKEGVDKLGRNVKNYVAILAMHERRSFFKPQDWSRLSVVDESATRACMLPFPGLHSTLVTVKEPCETAQIVRVLAVRFLEKHGTNFKPSLQLPHIFTAKEMCDKYAALVAYLSPNEGDTWQTSTTLVKFHPLGGAIKRRSFNTHSKMDLYTRGGKGSYWINQHHEMCFQEAYGDVYQALCTAAQVANRDPKSRTALHDLRSKSTRIFQSLYGKGWIVGDSNDDVSYGERDVGRPPERNNLVPGSPGFPLY